MTSHRNEDNLHEDLKHNEIRAAYVRGMLESNLEQNRHLLFVSSLILVILATVLSFGKVVHSFAPSVFWIFAAGCFVVCVISTLLFFSQNTDHLRHILDRNPKEKCCRMHLECLSKISAISFICGIILLVILVICNVQSMKKDELNPREFWRYPHCERMAPISIQVDEFVSPQTNQNMPGHHHHHHNK